MTRAVCSDIVIDTDPATVFDVLADPAQHQLFDGSGSLRGRVAGPPRLYLGATFSMRMRIGAPYLVRNRVVEYDEDRRIAWRHFGRHIWRYELTPLDVDGRASTTVAETFDYAPSPAAPLLELAKIPQRNLTAIEASLQQLKTLVESRTGAS